MPHFPTDLHDNGTTVMTHSNVVGGLGRPRPTGPLGPRAGMTAPALLFWLFAIALFVLPFLQQKADASFGLGDPRSKALWASEDTPFNELDLPYWERVAAVQERIGESLEGDLRQSIEEASELYFGIETKEQKLRNSGVIEWERLAAGHETYNEVCAGCHGGTLWSNSVPGDGAGPAARYMEPRPRNFRKGLFKFSSTQSGQRPMHKDLYKVVSYGLAGASMPHFKLLTEERRWDVVEYVRYISLRGEFEELFLTFTEDDEELADAEEVAEIVNSRWHPDKLSSVFPSTPETANDEASIARGRELYVGAKAGCNGCHGDTGVGDGPSADAFKDGWGYPIKPRDFTGGVYRAGSENGDLWVVIATGINGTPMGAFKAVLTSDEIWDIVHFVRSLEKTEGN